MICKDDKGYTNYSINKKKSKKKIIYSHRAVLFILNILNI